MRLRELLSFLLAFRLFLILPFFPLSYFSLHICRRHISKSIGRSFDSSKNCTVRLIKLSCNYDLAERSGRSGRGVLTQDAGTGGIGGTGVQDTRKGVGDGGRGGTQTDRGGRGGREVGERKTQCWDTGGSARRVLKSFSEAEMSSPHPL